jgi:hypothetical protein
MNDATMTDYEASYTTGGMVRADNNSMLRERGCDGEGRRQSSTATALALPSLRSKYSPVEMEGALRVMTHAGRILWRAAMEAIPGGVGSYNPSLSVLSKLFERSFGKSGRTTNNSHNNYTEKNNNNNNEIAHRAISAFSYRRNQVTKEDESDGFTADTMRETDDDSMETIPDVTSYSFEPIHICGDDEMVSQSKKRRPLFGISSLLSSAVVSDSEGEDDNYRPPKRRKTASVVRCW